MDNVCDGVVECTALVLAESCTEIDDRLTLFGILDEIRLAEEGETSFVVYAKFEGCEHASDNEQRARILLTDDDGEVLMESDEYSIWLDGTEAPVTIVAAFDLPAETYHGTSPPMLRLSGDGERILWIEAVVDDETLSQTVVRLHDRYSV